MSEQTATTAELASAVAQIQAELSELREHREVAEVYVSYLRGIDRLDEAAYRRSFWPNAQINYGSEEQLTPQQHWDQHMLKGHRDALLTWQHLLTNQTIDIDGDSAHVETYLTRIVAPKQKGKQDFMIGGRYVDRVDRKDGEWRIAVREFIPHFALAADSVFAEVLGNMFNDSRSAHGWDPMGERDVARVRPLNPREQFDGPPLAD